MAGEYLVAGQMSLRGWTANLTYKNYPGVDIIGQVVPEYYILSKQQVIDIINKSDDSWQAKDHKKPLSPDYPIKIYIERDALSKYRDKWEMLLANA